jgi:hypothetical protein
VFASNLRDLLLAVSAGAPVTTGLDPGFDPASRSLWSIRSARWLATTTIHSPEPARR